MLFSGYIKELLRKNSTWNRYILMCFRYWFYRRLCIDC